MKLTDAERLILLNQYRILAHLEDDEVGYRHAIDELELGLHEAGKNACPPLPEPISKELSDFAFDVMSMYEEGDKRFYGFEDERLNGCVRYWCGEIVPGKPLSDDEYRAMLAEYDGKPMAKHRRLSDHQQA